MWNDPFSPEALASAGITVLHRPEKPRRAFDWRRLRFRVGYWSVEVWRESGENEMVRRDFEPGNSKWVWLDD